MFLILFAAVLDPGPRTNEAAQLCNCRTRFEKVGKASQSGEVDSDEVRSGRTNKRRRPAKRAKTRRKSSENQRLKKAENS